MDNKDPLLELRHELEVLRTYVRTAEQQVAEFDKLQRNERERAISRVEERLSDLEVNMFGPNKSNGHVFYIKILWDERTRGLWLQRTVIGTVVALLVRSFWPEAP